MNKQLITDIKMAQKLIESEQNFEFKNIDLTIYQPIYLFTNENIKAITNNISFLNKEVLTVCSSGDQIFNMLLAGSKSIDAFDINIFTKYFYYLKEAAILSLSYQDFFDFFFPSKMLKKNKVFSKDLFNKLEPNIKNKEARIFWNTLFEIYPGRKLYYSNLFISNNYSKSINMKCNNYLKDETQYNMLKKYLNTYQLSFKRIDICTNITQELNQKKYNLIYLSNILDKLEKDTELEYVKTIKKIIMNLKQHLYPNGIIGVCYLFCYMDDYWYESPKSNLKSKIIRDNYFENDYYYKEFGSAFDLNGAILKNRDALMLTKNKE